MQLRDTIKTAFAGLVVHKSRSVLTILGIVIGITSITIVMSVGEGAQSYILGEIHRFGPNNVFILPGKFPTGPTSGMGSLLNDSLKLEDIKDLELKNNVPQAVKVVPFVFGSVPVSFENELQRMMVMGSVPQSQEIFNLEVERGRYFDQFDLDSHARVAVIGSTIAEDYFGTVDPLRHKLKIKGFNFEVVGVLASKGQGSFINYNKSVLTPYTSIQTDVLGIKYFQRVAVEAESEEAIPAVIEDVKRVLRDNHDISDPDKDDFTIQTQKDIAQSVGTITGILTVLLASVAAISLIVGGVGIMNIMFVSVTERTREIGLRKALGATNRNILTQFLVEAAVLTISGGIVGIAAGVVLTYGATVAVQRFAEINFPFSFSVNGMILGIVVSTGIGLIFGIFPARHAARKQPVEALRSG